MMTVCKARGAQKQHRAKHQGGGLPLSVHGCLQLLWGQAPFPHKIETRQARSLPLRATGRTVSKFAAGETAPSGRADHRIAASTAQVVQVDQVKFHLKGPMKL